MNFSDAHRLKLLEDGNAELRRLLADKMPDYVVPKDLLEKS